MKIKNLIVKDIIFTPSERGKVGKHVQRLLDRGWDEFSGFVDDSGLAHGEVHTAEHGCDLEVIQIHKIVLKLR